MAMPEGFCSWAWADLQRDVTHLAMGGEFPWMRQRGAMITCCTTASGRSCSSWSVSRGRR